jgi:hypothetical protein
MKRPARDAVVTRHIALAMSHGERSDLDPNGTYCRRPAIPTRLTQLADNFSCALQSGRAGFCDLTRDLHHGAAGERHRAAASRCAES